MRRREAMILKSTWMMVQMQAGINLRGLYYEGIADVQHDK